MSVDTEGLIDRVVELEGALEARVKALEAQVARLVEACLPVELEPEAFRPKGKHTTS